MRIQTFAGVVDAALTPVRASSDVVVAVFLETMSTADLEPLRRGLSSLWDNSNQRTHISLTIIRSDGMDALGRFESRSTFLSALRTATRSVGQNATPPETTAVYASLDQLPMMRESPWPRLLVVGRLREADEEIRAYIQGYTARNLREKRYRASYWSPGNERCETFDLVSRETAGVIAPRLPADLLAEGNADGSQFLELTWADPPLSAGYQLYGAAVTEKGGNIVSVYSSFAIAPGVTLPVPALHVQLRGLISTLKTYAARRSVSAEDLSAFQEVLGHALAINPRDKDALQIASAVYAQQGDSRSAAQALDSLSELDPLDAPLYAQSGHQLLRAGEYAGAQRRLLKARELKPGDAKVAEDLARTYVLLGKDAEAMPFFDDSLALLPDNSPLWFLKAEASERLRDWQRRAEALERGLEYDPGQLTRRTELIRLYIDRKVSDKALVHVRIVAHNPPSDPELCATYAGWMEQIGPPGEALALWRAALERGASLEAAHYGVTHILFDQGDFAGSIAAADEGLRHAPASARLYMVKASAQDKLGLWYDARRTLGQGAEASDSLELLRRHVETEDQFGGDAGKAYQRLVERCEEASPRPSDYPALLERGLIVSLRDGDSKQAEWFAGRLKLAGRPEFEAAPSNYRPDRAGEAVVPGGFRAALRAVGSPETVAREDYLLVFSRRMVAIGDDADKIIRARLADYFGRVLEIESLGKRTGDSVVLPLSTADKDSRRRAERVLNLLGWKMDTHDGKTAVEPVDKSSAAGKQLTTAALAVDEIGMQEALQSGRPFNLEIVDDWVPVLFSEAAWSVQFGKDDPPGGITEAIAADSDLARLYVGLSSMDKATAVQLVRDAGLRTLKEKHAGLLFLHSSAFSVAGGRVAVPGGAQAEPIWQKLVGVSPSTPKMFFSALLRQDDGKLLSFYADLMQLDLRRQRFFTASYTRTARFYELFKYSPDVQYGVVRQRRYTPFLDFMAEIPIDDQGHVEFPGSPEIWMVAKGESKSEGTTARLFEKVARIAAPEVEDEILLRLAQTAYTSAQVEMSELANFMAVVHVDAHREEPLDDRSALLLAQNYVQNLHVWPYLASLTGLGFEDLTEFLRLGQHFLELAPVQRNDALGEWEALTKLLAQLAESGTLTKRQSAHAFGALCGRFLHAVSPSDFAAASLESLRGILAFAAAPGGDPDKAIRDLLLGPRHPVTVHMNGHTYTVDEVENRRRSYQEVLDSQKVTRLQTVLDLYDSARGLASDSVPSAAYVKALEEKVGELQQAEVPPSLGVEKEVKDALLSFQAREARQAIQDMLKELSRKSADAKRLARLGKDFVGFINPQIRLALTGVIYARYLSPNDALVSEDPLFLRKHQFAELNVPGRQKYPYVDPALVRGRTFGSFLEGGFADFGALAGKVSMATLRQTDEANRPAGEAILGSLRETRWQSLRDADLRWVGLRILTAREWIVRAAFDESRRAELLSATLGILSPGCRIGLLRALEHRDWSAVWRQVTLSDLYFLCDAYLRTESRDESLSPTVRALRLFQLTKDASRLRWLGQDLNALEDCSHPHLVQLPPYEKYEAYLFPDRLVARAAEYKLYLAEFFDRSGLPAALLGAVAEPMAVALLKDMHLPDATDWQSILAAFHGINSKLLSKAMPVK